MYERPAGGVRRLWIPVMVILLATVAVVALWIWPNHEDFSNDYRSMGSWLAVFLGVLGLVGWWLFLSGTRWLKRIAIFVGVVALITGATWGAVDHVVYDGNSVPVGIRWRWEHHERGQHEATGEVAIPAEAGPDDFPEYRNSNRDGVVTGLNLDRGWAIHPPSKLWETSVGGGFSGISVVGPSAVTLEQVGDDEAVVCYDADKGTQRWIYSYPAVFRQIEPMGGNGPRTNPTIAGGDVYALGGTGHLSRLDGKTGKPKWEVNILGKRRNVYWGLSGSPLVTDRLVVVCPGQNREMGKKKEDEPGEGPAVVAYDRETGNVVWEAGDRQAGYSSPQLATIAGVRQVLVFDFEGIGSFDLESGKELWFYEWTNQTANVAQPLVFDDGRVFVDGGYGVGGVMLRVWLKNGKWNTTELWKNNRLRCKFSSPVYHDGHIYGIDESAGSLACLDVNDQGRLNWKDGRYGNGQILLIGDLILIESEHGKLVLVDANPEKWHEVASFQALEGRKNWNYLTVAHGRAYVRNEEKMACYELPLEKKK